MTTSRRHFLATASGLGAAWLLIDWARVDEALAYAESAVQQRPAPPFSTLTADEGRELGAVVERIIPTTETPGAREAGVIFFIDKALGSLEREALADIRAGLADLKLRTARRKQGTGAFAALPTTDQDALLAELEETDFFQATRYLTMVGMYAHPSHGGNRDRVGWKNLGFEPRPSHTAPFGHYDAEASGGR